MLNRTTMRANKALCPHKVLHFYKLLLVMTL
jgi:hypothetical protein